jgi:hypothetical protein
MLFNPQANVQRVGSQQIRSDKIQGSQMEPERGPRAYADSFARYITKQYGARGNTRALDLYICALWGQDRPLHLISNDKSSAVVKYLNSSAFATGGAKRRNEAKTACHNAESSRTCRLDLVAGTAGSSKTMAA